MADKSVYLRATDNTNISTKYHDNGDGTYSQTEYANGGTAPTPPTGASATQVQGTAADAAAAVGNPVLIGGFDTTNVQNIHTDTSGDLQVDVLTMPQTGSATIATGQATAGAASGALVAAAATRRSVLVRNLHATDSCYIGPGTVTSANGMLLKAGESITINTVAAINGIRAGSADVIVAYLEELG